MSSESGRFLLKDSRFLRKAALTSFEVNGLALEVEVLGSEVNACCFDHER